MSKSLGNYVGVTEPPDEIYGKVMSISDELMLRWYDVLHPDVATAVRRDLTSGALHPRDAKASLAQRQVARFHGDDAARAAAGRFDERFTRRELPAEMVTEWRSAEPIGAEVSLPTLLTQMGLTKSNSDARRLIAQGAVRIDGVVVRSERYTPASGSAVADAAISTSARGANADTSESQALLIEVGKRRVARALFPRRGRE
jgi:tyrosyl-tRNA synthetase